MMMMDFRLAYHAVPCRRRSHSQQQQQHEPPPLTCVRIISSTISSSSSSDSSSSSQPADPQKRAKTGRNAGKISPVVSVNGQQWLTTQQ
jgi:hypothetical protein